MRYIVFGVILFLPLIVYFTWAYIVTRKMEETGGKWNDGPITKLFLAGLVLMAGALVVSRFMNPGDRPTRIVPEQYADDRFIRQGGEGRRPGADEAGPPASPGLGGERLLAEDRAFLEEAENMLTGYLNSGDIELLDTLVSKHDDWGPVLRADVRRRVEGRSQPRQRLVIWQVGGGLHMELVDGVGLAPLSNFASELSFPLDSLPDFEADDPSASSAD